MENTDIIHIKEGLTENYASAMHDYFGGVFENNSYYFKQGRTEINMITYPILPEFEIVTANAISQKTLVIDRIPDKEPDLIHLTFFKEGEPLRDGHDAFVKAAVDSPKGVFMHNGLFPLKTTFHANTRYRSISFKFTKSAFLKILPEAEGLFHRLFGHKDPMAYHLLMNPEQESVLNHIYKFKKADFGRIPLVVSRSLELFTLFFKSIEESATKEELNGLHIDDYRRLLDVKEKLLSSFNQRISIENIASEFAVSVSKLKRDFKTMYNCSIYQFYTSAKMDEAYRLLKTGNYSVMDVGYEMGYQNLSKFSQMFKKVKGIFPREVISV